MVKGEEDIEQEELWERWRCEVDKGQGKERIDKYLAEHMTNTSRNRIQTAADAGNVWVNGAAVASNYRVKPGDVIQVLLDHEPHDFTITPENIPLDIVYEDADLLVVNKPAGLVVHPGHGNYEHTLLHALARAGAISLRHACGMPAGDGSHPPDTCAHEAYRSPALLRREVRRV